MPGTTKLMKQKMDIMIDTRDEALKKMIESANQKLSGMTNIVGDRDAFIDSLVLSFNYTSMLKELYKIGDIRDVLYLHGYFADNDKLIFGYSEPVQDVLKQFGSHVISDENMNRINWDLDEEEHDDFYIQKQCQAMYDFYLSNKKIHELEKLESWLEPYKDVVEEIIVLGHSMGLVDQPYFEKIEEMLKPPKWLITRYNDQPTDKYMQCYSFYAKVEPGPCKIEDFIPLL